MTVMLLTFPFAWKYLLPNAFIEYSKSILYSLGFSSNIFFLYTGQLYGAESSLLKPFLHTWSLSVEEQFYIAYPCFIYFFYKFCNKYLSKILIFIFLLSFIMAVILSYTNPNINFYILPTRAWELIAGGLVAYYEINKKNTFIKKKYEKFILYGSLAAIIYTLLFFDETTKHPSILTLVPVLGTSLIITIRNKNILLIKILSSKPFVGIGLISYSLYLWHFPIFSFARIIGLEEQNIIIKLVLILFSICLSILTYFFIEKPARKKS